MPVNRTQWTHPDLQSLAGLFFEDASQLGAFTEIQAESMPQPYRKLLAHTSHMTVTLENHHDTPVDVVVLDKRITNNHYARKSLLTRKSDGVAVQFGIVRLATTLLAPEICQEVESESTPLGRVLINRDVLRTVKLMSCWEIAPGPALLEAFGLPNLKACYGRTALIYTDGVPAVELLEIVADV